MRANLGALASNPPQSLLIEGGTENQRFEFGLYWAMLANCPTALAATSTSGGRPCMECAVCRQIEANEHLDLRVYDGRISNSQDEERPGPIKALRMENMRELKASLGIRPHGTGKKVVIFQGMNQTREEALNSLLKTIEEPSPYTLFVLLAPQRQQILPTLVSRSICLTLPWTDSSWQNEEVAKWEKSLCDFFNSGSDFLDKIAAKGAINAVDASQLILSLQRALARGVKEKETKTETGGILDSAMARLAGNANAMTLATSWLMEAQNMLNATANPVRVLEALSTKLYLLVHQT